MPEVILGTGLSHDGSSCVMRNGLVEIAIEKERLTGRKHDGLNDDLTIEYCLKNLGLSWKDVSLVVENLTINPLDAEDDLRRGARMIPSGIPKVSISHHLAHAYSAFGPSPFSSCAAIVVDGRGSSLDNCHDAPQTALEPDVGALSPDARSGWFEMNSVYLYDDAKLEPVMRDFSPFVADNPRALRSGCQMANSIGEFYGRVAHWVFGPGFNEGKLMGLAPYGRPNAFTAEALFVANGRSKVDLSFLEYLDPDLESAFHRRRDSFQHYADVAYWAQKELERGLIELFCWARKTTGARNIAYAGGVALNAVANRRLLLESGFENMFVQPAAGDNGIALGCCHYGLTEVGRRPRRSDPVRSAFGRRYTVEECRAALATLDPDAFLVEEPEDMSAAVACRLAGGEAIGWFKGSCEFGPRALGHRSILADPRGRQTQDYINREVKTREDFRPFAPAVIAEEAATFFDGNYPSPHMIFVMQTRPEWRDKIPAVVHRDGSARVQTVTSRSDPDFYSLLQAFGRESGLPMLLNTSFNGRGMPIVETPDQAVRFFARCGLHALVLESILVVKRNPPARLPLAGDS